MGVNRALVTEDKQAKYSCQNYAFNEPGCFHNIPKQVTLVALLSTQVVHTESEVAQIRYARDAWPNAPQLRSCNYNIVGP